MIVAASTSQECCNACAAIANCAAYTLMDSRACADRLGTTVAGCCYLKPAKGFTPVKATKYLATSGRLVHRGARLGPAAAPVQTVPWPGNAAACQQCLSATLVTPPAVALLFCSPAGSYAPDGGEPLTMKQLPAKGARRLLNKLLRHG